MAKILYYDASCGISGDMNLAALVELGVDFGYLCAELEKLNLAGEFKLVRKSVLKNGIAATKIDVVPLKSQPHARSYAGIRQILESSNLSQSCKQRAGAIFRRIAQVEAKVHGTDVDQVHFHEIGAIDSIVDIAGAAICFEYLFENLGVSRVVSSKIELGGGVAICDHGELSVPAPAVCEILKGVPVSLGRANFEMTTPTGAAILKACADEFTDGASFKIEKIGYGAGGKDATDFANVLRAMICEVDEDLYERNLAAHPGYGEVCKQILISTNIDDMDAESFAFACEILRENGALDIFSRSIFMKKGRMGFELNTLCRKHDAQNLKDLIFTHTTAIGVREVEVTKTELKREFARVQTKFGEIGVKISGSGQTQKAKPEFDDCKAAALAHGTTIERVRKEALKIYDETRKTKG
ncbi:MAG: nickel pincer cofactor biosynthesis protein LarC [Campylobacter gracilis]|uniref:nickel pincer cofactor biosynthesis protein LarC n=1 Tax=Campylobacter gracilis TaxID=824 RepID=UPI0026F0308C|nr:nickel pincer cofactor biosynthesis protein LarC [Campylobacter gracilis]MBS6152681.1 nickel pincer cofactor biosynthesis protein LarC [Campylobacter gracilis]